MGCLPESYLIRLILELEDQIKINQKAGNIEISKILIIQENDPSERLENLMEEIPEKDNNIEVCYLKANIFSYDQEWIDNANLKFAEKFLVFSICNQ